MKNIKSEGGYREYVISINNDRILYNKVLDLFVVLVCSHKVHINT